MLGPISPARAADTRLGSDRMGQADEGTVVSEHKPALGRDMQQSSGGYDMVLSGVLFSLVGLWLDRQLGFTPVLTIVLAVVGFTGGVLNVYYRYMRDMAAIEAAASGNDSPADGESENSPRRTGES